MEWVVMKKIVVLLIGVILIVIIAFSMKGNVQGEEAQIVLDDSQETEVETLFPALKLKSYLSELVSVEFDGRFPGTPGNIAAAEFIRTSMMEIGIESPAFAKNYFMTFSAIIPIKLSKTTLVLETVDQKVEFVFGRDYVEFVTRNFAKGKGKFSGQFKIMDDPLNLYDFGDSDIVVYTLDAIKDISYDSLFNHILLEKNKPKMVLYESNQQNSGYFVLSPYSRMVTENDNQDGMLIYKVSQSVVEALLSHSGGILHAFTEVELSRIEMPNVVGMIDGSGETGYVIMAHFDHLGHNFDGTYNPGALDNASGVATMLALSEVLIKQGDPELDYYFIAFNAEEAGLY